MKANKDLLSQVRCSLVGRSYQLQQRSHALVPVEDRVVLQTKLLQLKREPLRLPYQRVVLCFVSEEAVEFIQTIVKSIVGLGFLLIGGAQELQEVTEGNRACKRYDAADNTYSPSPSGR